MEDETIGILDYRERCASAYLHRAVERAMVALYTRCSLIPATVPGYEMIRNEIAGTLGDLRSGAVNVEPQPPGFYVTWNGVDCTWLGLKTTAPRAEAPSSCNDLTLEQLYPVTEQHLRDVRDASVSVERRLAAADWLCEYGFTSYPMFKDGAALDRAYSDNARRPKSPVRPDGFSQSAVDAAKAVLLATGAKRGGK